MCTINFFCIINTIGLIDERFSASIIWAKIFFCQVISIKNVNCSYHEIKSISGNFVAYTALFVEPLYVVKKDEVIILQARLHKRILLLTGTGLRVRVIRCDFEDVTRVFERRARGWYTSFFLARNNKSRVYTTRLKCAYDRKALGGMCRVEKAVSRYPHAKVNFFYAVSKRRVGCV